MTHVKHFPLNTAGCDFVVGDIHGCFDVLRGELAANGFDESQDRLFSVGDLVDRGPSSNEAIDWIVQPWFHAVRGNHEQMAIGVAQGKHDWSNYAMNGGGWFLALDDDRQQLIAKVFDTLPYAIEVDTPAGLVGIVHAEVAGDNWQEFVAALDADASRTKLRNIHESALWARSKITYALEYRIEGVHRVYVGHTPVKAPVTLGNVVYIDTGAVFGEEMTVVEINGAIEMREAA